MEIICGIYKITSPTGRIYIGQSVNVLARWQSHRTDRRQNTILCNSILKHGYDSHKFEILERCKESDLNRLEKHYVDKFDSFNSITGMNLRDGGGSHGRFCDATKQKISRTRIERKIKASKEQAQKQSASLRLAYATGKRPKPDMRGSRNPFFGKHPSLETISHLSKIRTGLLVSGRNGRAKLVLNTQTGIFYDSVTDAALSIGRNANMIMEKLRGDRNNNTPFVLA